MRAGYVEITEGDTRLLVPAGSLGGAVPPRGPAFFNPRAAITRDYSVLAYSCLLGGRDGLVLDAMAGVGARGLRAANESGAGRVILNDANAEAIEAAKESAIMGGIDAEYSVGDACAFLARYSGRGRRASIVDVDPFGSPAPYIDCATRAVARGGMLAVAATDLQVLGGLQDAACRRKYGGVPVRVQYGNEVAIRLVLGCVWSVCARLGVGMEPLFAHSDMHYYRIYVRICKRRAGGLGHMAHCDACGQRGAAGPGPCHVCGGATRVAGPLWTGALFEAGFIEGMIKAAEGASVDASCAPALYRCLEESGMPAAYHTTDEVASRARAGPPKLADAVRMLRGAGYAASPTSLHPSGFRTDADARQVLQALYPRNPRHT